MRTTASATIAITTALNPASSPAISGSSPQTA
jgi:hypothetical protein